MAFRLEDTAAARRDLQALPRDTLIRIESRIQALAENPHPRGVERVQGSQGGLHVRVGDYRILYTVDDARQVVTIGHVRHRRDVYRCIEDSSQGALPNRERRRTIDSRLTRPVLSCDR